MEELIKKFINHVSDCKFRKNINAVYETARFYYRDQEFFYHTIFHINSMKVSIEHIKQYKEAFIENYENLLFAIYFHDCVYYPGYYNNEEESYEIYRKFFGDNEIIKNAILSTKIGNKTFNGPVEQILHDLDWMGFNNFETMLSNEQKIEDEAVLVGGFNRNEVKENQLKFYQSIADKDIYVTDLYKPLNLFAKINIQTRISQLKIK